MNHGKTMNKTSGNLIALTLAITLLQGVANAQPPTCTAPPPVLNSPSFSGAPPNEGYQVMYHDMWEFVRDHYFDPSRLKNWDALEHKYDDKLGTIADMQLAFGLMADATGDKWTTFTSAQEMQDYAAVQRQGLVIGGLMLYRHGQHYQIDVIHYGSAAYGTVLRERDIITCLNKVAIDPLSRQQVDQLLRGHPGDKLVVNAISADDGSPYEVELTLALIPKPVVEARLLSGNIVYIRMPTFGGEKYIDEFVNEFNRVVQQAGGQVRGMVLDLRNNLGGELPVATTFSSLFLSEGQIVTKSIIRGQPVKDILVVKADQIMIAKAPIDQKVLALLRTLPLTILANRSSASAAEITLSALKDNHRGPIIGVTSFGKGVGYKTRRGPVGGLMSLTSLKYLTPAGADVHERGIDPDVSLPVPRGEAKDIQLDEAIKKLEVVLASKP